MADEQTTNTTNTIDDLKDVNKIINAVSASTNALAKIIGSVNKLSEKIEDIKNIDKSVKRVQKTIIGVQEISKSLVDALTTMNGVFALGDMDALNQLLVDANEYVIGEDGLPVMQDGQKLIKTSRQTLPVILCKVSEGKIIDAMGKLGNVNIGPISALKAQRSL